MAEGEREILEADEAETALMSRARHARLYVGRLRRPRLN